MREGTTEPAVQPGAWTQLTITAADFGLQAGRAHRRCDAGPDGRNRGLGQPAIGRRGVPARRSARVVDRVAQILGQTVPPELPGELHPLIQGGPDKPLTADELAKLQTYYLAMVARPATPDLNAARQIWEAAQGRADRRRRVRDRDLHLSRTGPAPRIIRDVARAV